MSCWSYMKKTSNGTIDITPNIGHVHTKDADWQGRGIKTQVPVSLANDRTGERFRIDVHKTPIGEIAKKHKEMLY